MSESKRRKDYCIDCALFKPIKSKGRCQNCWHKYKTKYNARFFLRQKYSQIKQRCMNKRNKQYNNYNGKLKIDIETFYNRFINDSAFNKLYKEWQLSDFDYKKCPSIDRIDSNGDYSLDNIQFITHSENCIKDQSTAPVLVTKINGDFIGEFKSLNDAVRATGTHQSNAWKVCNGVRKHTKGYVFKYV